MNTRRATRLLKLGLIVSDVASLAVAFTLAYVVRFATPLGERGGSDPSVGRYIWVGVLTLIGAPAIFAMQGLYRSAYWMHSLREHALIIQGTIYSVIVIAFLSFLVGGPPVTSRAWVVWWFVFATILLATGRFVFRRVAGWMRSRRFLLQRVIIAGANDQGIAIGRQLMVTPGIEVAGFVDDFLPLGTLVSDGLHILGPADQLGRVAEAEKVDEVVLVSDALTWEAMREQLERIVLPGDREGASYKVSVAPGMYEIANLDGEIEYLANVPLVRFRPSSLRMPDAVIKRSFDIVVALGILVASSPLLLAAVVWARARRRLPFRRIPIRGLGGSTIHMQVFSTDSSREPRTVPEGWRRMPALGHVLAGGMSLVGPRPRYAGDGSAQEELVGSLHSVKPGVIGIIPFRTASVTDEQRLQIEAFYTRNYSIWTDAGAVVQAALVGLKELPRWRM